MSCDKGVHTGLSVRHSRATGIVPITAVTRPHFRPKLSPHAARVMEELSAQSVTTLSQLALMRLLFRDCHTNSVRPVVTCPINFFAHGLLAR